MSSNYHTPFAFNSGITSATMNTRLGSLDQGITDNAASITALQAIFAGTTGYDRLNLGAGSELTIATGAVTISESRHTIDTESDAASDYLDTINASSGDVGVLYLENASRVITIRHLQDNIFLHPALDYTWSSTSDPIRFFYDGTYMHLFTTSTQAEAVALVVDQKAQNTDAGTFTNGAWRTRVINTKIYDANVICSITKLAFTSGGTYEVVVGDTITGATSTETATVFDVELTSGTWAAGTAAGNLWLNDQSGAFVAENLDVGTNTNVATVGADSTHNEVRLKTGTYRFDGSAPAFAVDRHQTRLQNTSDASTTATGASTLSAAATSESGFSQVLGRTTIAAAKTFELQHRCQTTKATTGLGPAANLTVEIFAQLRITKEL